MRKLIISQNSIRENLFQHQNNPKYRCLIISYETRNRKTYSETRLRRTLYPTTLRGECPQA